MCPRIVDKELKKQDILASALKVFARQGVSRTKMIDIAVEAGIGKGTIYEYFRSKEEIIRESFQAFFAKMDKVKVDPFDKDMNAIEQLFHVIDGWMNLLNEEPLEAQVIIDIWAEMIRLGEGHSLEFLLDVYKEYRDYLARIIEEGIGKGEIRSVDTQSMATMIAATLDGLYLYWVMGKGTVNLEESLNAFKSTLSVSLKQN